MNVIIFGIGRYYENRKNKIEELIGDYNIVVFADNRADEIREFESHRVVLPCEIFSYDYDMILIMSKNFEEMKNQLISLGVLPDGIFSYDKLVLFSKRGKYKVYPAKKNLFIKKKVLIITSDMGFNGGNLAVFFLSKKFIASGYCVCVATSERYDVKFRDYLVDNGIEFIVFESFPYIGGEDLEKIGEYDVVISNVLQTIFCAKTCSGVIPTIWWLHESDNEQISVYRNIKRRFYECNDTDWMKNVRIIAVSDIAGKAFEQNYSVAVDDIIPVGIEDWKLRANIGSKKIVVALIGHFMRNKGQKIFLEAVSELIFYDNSEFWLIGGDVEADYAEEIRNSYVAGNCIKLLGVKSNDEVKSLYQDIDVVVCASYMETMSMTVIEGMMNSKICITTDNTGIAEYIEDGVNGFICKAGDVDSLRDKMQYVIDNFDSLYDVRKNARKTYEKYFTLDILGQNMEREIDIAISEFSNSAGE